MYLAHAATHNFVSYICLLFYCICVVVQLVNRLPVDNFAFVQCPPVPRVTHPFILFYTLFYSCYTPLVAEG